MFNQQQNQGTGNALQTNKSSGPFTTQENKPATNVFSQPSGTQNPPFGASNDTKKEENKAMQPPTMNRMSEPQTENKNQNMFLQKPSENA